jgi:hypothetical protein
MTVKVVWSLVVAGALLACVDAGLIQAEPHTGDLHNCEDFTYREDAQQHLAENPSDPDNLDDDDDGLACEHLPSRPGSSSGGSSSQSGASSAQSIFVTGGTWGPSVFADDSQATDAQGSEPPSTTSVVFDHHCADFPTQQAAQAHYEFDPSGHEGLDPDHDGIACEDNPSVIGTPPLLVIRADTEYEPDHSGHGMQVIVVSLDVYQKVVQAHNEGRDAGEVYSSLTNASTITPPSTGDGGLLKSPR